MSLGQQWTQNPNLSFGGSKEHSLFSTLDPIGNAVTKIGGDPLNLYGNKNNPNALLFPSTNNSGSTSGVPAVLPTLPNVGGPKFYDPNSFGPDAYLGSGKFNAMASQMAGPQYRPMPMTGAPQQKPGQASGAGGVALAGPRNPIGIGMPQPVVRARQ